MNTTLKVACFGDLHGVLPDVYNVKCDLAIIAGDVCPEQTPLSQHVWLAHNFIPWLNNFPRVVWIAGNHDYVCEKTPHLVPAPRGFNHHYLLDSGTCISNLRIWGTPWSLPYGNYSFMADEDDIARRLSGLDVEKPHIVVSHGPPYGHGDIGHRHEKAGSKALLTAIQKHQPWLVVYGHIHEGRGVYYEGNSLLVNAAMAGDSVGVGLDHPPIIVEFDHDGNIMGITS